MKAEYPSLSQRILIDKDFSNEVSFYSQLTGTDNYLQLCNASNFFKISFKANWYEASFDQQNFNSQSVVDLIENNGNI